MSLLITLASALVLANLVGAAEPSHVHRLKSLEEQCAFKLEDTSYDLCPVLNGNEGGWTIEFQRRTPPTVTKTSYKIDLKTPLKKDSRLPVHEQCPDGTWICQTISNSRPRYEGEEPHIIQVIPVAGAMHIPNITRYHPGLNTTVQRTPMRENSNASALHVRLHGGYYVGGPQKADFQFLCDPTVDEPSSPTYAWTWNGTHTFRWRTKHACGSRQAKPPAKDEDVPPISEPEDDAPPVDDESDGQELIGGHPLSWRIARSTMILLLSSLTAFITFTYLAWRPPARMRHYLASIVKAHPRLGRFRIGERMLVRWAYEDLEMDGYEGGDEDTMVNFAPQNEAGEGVPLKPSPRRGRWISYGTA